MDTKNEPPSAINKYLAAIIGACVLVILLITYFNSDWKTAIEKYEGWELPHAMIPDACVALLAYLGIYFWFERKGIDFSGVSQVSREIATLQQSINSLDGELKEVKTTLKSNHQDSVLIEEVRRIRGYREYGIKNSVFRKRFEELLNGRCVLASLKEVYEDDIQSIKDLEAGEELLSTCPMSRKSDDDRLIQIDKIHYKTTMEAYCEAATKGVLVTRIYLFETRTDFGPEKLKEHLRTLADRKLSIRVGFYDELGKGRFDFVVFGNHKVSIGEVDEGAVKAGTIRLDAQSIAEKTAFFNDEVLPFCETIEAVAISPSP